MRNNRIDLHVQMNLGSVTWLIGIPVGANRIFGSFKGIPKEGEQIIYGQIVFVITHASLLY